MRKIIFALFLAFVVQFSSSQWVEQIIPGNTSLLNCVSFSSLQIGQAGGWESKLITTGRIIYTTNGGLNWISAAYPDSLRVLLSISAFDQQNAYGSGACNLHADRLKELFNFSTFQFKENKPIQGKYDANFGNVETRGYFLKTTNGGQSWVPYGTLPVGIIYLYDACFQNSSTGFAAANTEFSISHAETGIIKTNNGGLSWNFVSSPDSAQELRRIKFFNSATGVAVGYDRDFNSHFPIQGLILRTTNSGNNWIKQRFYDVNNFNDVTYINSLTGFACGVSNSDIIFSAVIYKTTNSGATWNKLSFQIDTAFFQGINFVEGTGKGFVFGSKYKEDPKFPGFFMQTQYVIARTTDYGQTWYTNYKLDSINVLLNSFDLDQSNWYISGGDFYSNGLMLKTTNGGGPIGINPISSEIPVKFTLYQNYPNPFNPSTNIRFDLPKAGNVSFKVFDVLGKIVYELNEAKQAGKYEISFDGSNYASGIYYYRVGSESYFEVKKMVLLK